MAAARELNIQLLDDVEQGSNGGFTPQHSTSASLVGTVPTDCSCRTLSFGWVFPLLRRAAVAERLEAADLFPLPSDGQPEALYQAFIEEWRRRFRAAGARPAGAGSFVTGSKPGRVLLRCLFRLQWPSMRLLWVGRLVTSLLGFAFPYAINQITKYVQSNDQSAWTGLSFAFLAFVANFLIIVIDNNVTVGMQSLGLRIRSCMMVAISRKVLLLRQDSLLHFSTGKLNNMITTDVDKARRVVRFLHLLVVSPIVATISLVSMYHLLGVSVFIGLGWMGTVILINPLMMRLESKLEEKQQEKTDERVRKVTEVITSVQFIKSYGWEGPALASVEEARSAELHSMWLLYCVHTVFEALWSSIVPITTAVMFASYSLLNPDTPLDPATAFTAISLLGILQAPLFTIPWVLTLIVEALVAAKRIESLFLLAEARLPSTLSLGTFCPLVESDAAFEDGGQEAPDERLTIDLRGESFQWSCCRQPRAPGSDAQGDDSSSDSGASSGAEEVETDAASGTTTDGTNNARRRVFRLQDLHLQVPRGALVAVVGATASGKSSLLQAILGEMPKVSDAVPGHPEPMHRQKPIAFAPQQPWIFNATVRQNILFGQPYLEQKYSECVRCCGLDKDFTLLKDGDLTLVGEKGIALSGGQKARVCLARAVYRKDLGHLVLLDDPYSALDAHVARKIHEEVMVGMLRGRTRIVATNRLEFTTDCDFVVVMVEGRVAAVGSYEELRDTCAPFRQLLEAQGASTDAGCADPAALPRAPESLFTRTTSAHSAGSVEEPLQIQRSSSREGNVGADDDEEFRATGQLDKSVFYFYLRKMGRPVSVIVLASLYVFSELIELALPVWLAHWTTSAPTVSNMQHYLNVYICLSIVSVVFMTIRDMVGNIYGFRAARRLHRGMLAAVLRAPLSFFQDTPHGRIINRFSKDTSEIDKELIWSMIYTFVPLLSTLGQLLLVGATAFLALLVFLPAFWLYFRCWKLYNPVALDIKRITKVSSSPVYDHFNNLCREGALSCVRALHQVDDECTRNTKLVGEQQRPEYSQVYVEQWFCSCVQSLGGLLLFAVAVFAVLGKGHFVTAGTAALALTFAAQFSSGIEELIWHIAEFGIAFNCVERVMEYSTTLAEEAALITDRRPAEDWPSAGVLEVWNLQLRYRPGSPLVLRGLTFKTRAGERLGIVGRTGAGKSSLLLALLRIVEAEAGSKVCLDGEDLMQLGLQDIRSRIATIPQEPVLFQETLRYNCDPFSRHTSAEIWHALQEAQLAPWIESQRRGAGAGSPTTNDSARRAAQDTPIELSSDIGICNSVPEDVEKLLAFDIKEGGQNLSAGQRQMVAIARAVLRCSKFVLLDEATAALDSATDAAVQLAVRRCFVGATTLTIAHRLQTIMDSDRVMVLEQGELAELGPPAELREREGGIFRGMLEEAKL